VSTLPPVVAGSGQRPGETMEAFFLRRKKKCNAILLRETPEAKARREQKEKHAEKGQVPGNQGARVFTWEEIDGYFIRQPAGRKNYEGVWEDYSPAQRVYDSFHDEWDCCEKFGDAADHSEDGDGDDDAGDWDADGLTPETHQKYEGIANTVQQMVHLRFGCMVPTGKVHTELNNLPNDILMKRILGDKDLTFPNDIFSYNLSVFLAHCCRADSVNDIPRELLDYRQPTTAMLFKDWTVDVHREWLNDKLYYILRDKGHSDPLHLLVNNAVTTLEIIRQGWGPSLPDIAEHLLARGIAFRLCYRDKQTTTALPSDSQVRKPHNLHSGLGYRPKSYKPDVLDLQTYLVIRDQFLSSPRGRAALLYGGIVGRIAREVVSNDEVMKGPTDDAPIAGICLCSSTSTAAYWDDHLTDDEIDLICGVYHVATGLSISLLTSIT
ncbi:hypothetical protein B0H10DRAFT_1787511, partial [Mycena sp. CBHHK59/15]